MKSRTVIVPLLVLLSTSTVTPQNYNFCKPEVVQPSKRIHTEICPLMKKTGVRMKDLMDCKERHGYRMRYGVEVCANKQFKNPAFTRPEVVEQLTCDKRNVLLIDAFACCVISVGMPPYMNAYMIIQIAKKCTLNPFQ